MQKKQKIDRKGALYMAEQLTLTWIGHSCFKLDCGDYTIVFDPYEDGYVPGCPPVRESADLVLCSHDHKDHGASHLVKRIEGRENPFQIQVIHTWHDDQKGALRGRNQIHILDDGTFRMAHMGDLGCKLTEEEMKQLRGLDLMLIPVGGYYTIDAKQAKALVEQVKPRIVVPMHYRGEGFGYDVLGTVKDYMDLCETAVYGDSEVLVLEKSGVLESDQMSASDQNPASAQVLSWRAGTQSGTLRNGQEETVVLRMAKDE